jgi:hypothetical protein
MKETQRWSNTDDDKIVVQSNRDDSAVGVMNDTIKSSAIRQESCESSKHNACISISNLVVPKCMKNFVSWIRAIAIVAALKNLIKFGIYIYDIVSKCNLKKILYFLK